MNYYSESFLHAASLLSRQITLVILSLTLAVNAQAAQQDIDQETAKLFATFSGDNFPQQRKALNKMGWSGVSSTKVYDVIERRLLALKNADSKQDKEKAAWLAKGLAYSGNTKYLSTLEEIAANADAKKVRKYAEQSLESLKKYQAWNPVTSANLAAAPAGRLAEARVANMLSATDYQLLRIGAKRVYHGHKADTNLIKKAATRLRAEYPIAEKSNSEQIDALAWLIKVMAESGDKQYRTLLLEISDKAKVKKIKKYAKKYASYLE